MSVNDVREEKDNLLSFMDSGAGKTSKACRTAI